MNFYAHLQTLADGHVGEILDALDECGLTESTLIVRLADHGEMGMCHGLREKMYTAYEEAIHVPLIFSNPLLFRLRVGFRNCRRGDDRSIRPLVELDRQGPDDRSR